MSNLELVEASEEFRFVHEEDSVILCSPWIDTVRHLCNIFLSPYITYPGATLTSAAMDCGIEVIIVIISTLVWVSIVPLARVTILIKDCLIAIAESSRPFSFEILVAEWVSKHVDLCINSFVQDFDVSTPTYAARFIDKSIVFIQICIVAPKNAIHCANIILNVKLLNCFVKHREVRLAFTISNILEFKCCN